MHQLLKQVLLVCACLLAEQVIADSLTDGKNAYVVGKYAKAEKLFRPLAKQGNAEAQTSLGRMYAEGQGVRQNYKEAVKWFRLAAEQGHASAQQSLGVMYDKGRGVPKDYNEAMKWFRLAAEQGNASAQQNLVVMYSEGHGVPQDYVLALMWEYISASNAAIADSEGQTQLIEQPNSVAMHMTTKQIAKARGLAGKCTVNQFKGC